MKAAILKEIERRKRNRERAQILRNDFGQFIRFAWNVVEPAKPLIDNWHIDAIAIHLQAVAEGRIRFLMINIGPGYAKSIIASVMFSAWLWVRNPETRIMAATYASALTVRDSIRTRDLIESDWYRDTFNPDWKAWRIVKSNEDWISNTRSGERRALSVGGKATGFRGDGQIFDDLLNASDKHSEAARTTAKDWAIRTMSTRFNDMRSGWRVVIGQRLHEDDPYGAMLATGDYAHLCLPSEFEPERRCKTVLGWEDPRTVPGELLFPELFTRKVIEKAKRDLGAYDYSGQHQQRPAPAEGGLFKREWWRYYTQPPQFELIVVSVDATFKKSTDADFVAIHVYGFLGPRAYLLDRIHAQMGFTATKQAIRGLFDRWKPQAVLIEDTANGPAIIDELTHSMHGVIAIRPDGGKIARAWACSPDVEAGNVYLPESGTAQEVVEEAAQFPNGAHDDDVDALTQALNWRRDRGSSASWVFRDAWSTDLLYSETTVPVGLRGPGGHEEHIFVVAYGTAEPCVFLDILDDGSTWWVDREFYWDSRARGEQKTDGQHADALSGFMAGLSGIVILDPDAATFKAELLSRGVWLVDGKDKELDAIRTLSTLMRAKRLRIHERCENLRREILSYSWDSSKEEKPLRQNDKSCRALEFWAATRIPAWRMTN